MAEQLIPDGFILLHLMCFAGAIASAVGEFGIGLCAGLGGGIATTVFYMVKPFPGARPANQRLTLLGLGVVAFMVTVVGSVVIWFAFRSGGGHMKGFSI